MVSSPFSDLCKCKIHHFKKCGLLLSKCEKTQCPSHMHKWWLSWLCHIYTAAPLQSIAAPTARVPIISVMLTMTFLDNSFLLSFLSTTPLNLLPERPLMTDRRRNGFHGDPILVEEGPFCKNVSRSASSLKLCLQREKQRGRKDHHLFGLCTAPLAVKYI